MLKSVKTIRTIYHVTKLAVMKLVVRIVERRIEGNMGEDQFGFRECRGTRDALDV